MLLSDTKCAEFMALCEADGIIFTAEEAREAAERLILLYRVLARPLPDLPKADHEVKSAKVTSRPKTT